MPRTLTLEEAAGILKTTADTVSDCIRSRGLPAARIGRAFVLVDDDVIAWVREQYGNWNTEKCESILVAKKAFSGSTSRLTTSALDAALAPQTGARRRNTPRALRLISGGPSASEKRHK